MFIWSAFHAFHMYRREYYRRSNRSEHLPPGYGPALLIAEWGNLSSLNSRKFTQRRHSHLTKLGDRHTCVPFFPLAFALFTFCACFPSGGQQRKPQYRERRSYEGIKKEGITNSPERSLAHAEAEFYSQTMQRARLRSRRKRTLACRRPQQELE